MPPQQPQPDFDTAQDLATNTYNAINSSLSNAGCPGFIGNIIGGVLAGLAFGLSFLVLIFLNGLIAVGSWAVNLFVNLYDQAKQDNQAGINQVIADSMSELLGVEIDPGSLAAGSGAGASMDANLAIGNAIIEIFEDQFNAGGAVTPQQGANNARTFLGWSVNFATSEGFLSICTEMMSLGFLKEVKEFPSAIRQAMGMGRLQRVALQPLIQQAITKPYTYYCNNLFRPTRLSEGQLVKALHNGTMDADTVNQQLSELGWSDDLIEFVLQDFASKLSLGDLMLLLVYGDISQDDVTNNLTLTGLPEDQAALQITAYNHGKEQTHWDALRQLIYTRYRDGYIDEATYNNMLGQVPTFGDEDTVFRQLVGFDQETPRKTLSFADVKEAVVANILPFSYIDTWLQNQGYDTESQNILSWQIMQAITTAEQKQAYASYKAQVLKAANKPVPPWISDAEKAV